MKYKIGDKVIIHKVWGDGACTDPFEPANDCIGKIGKIRRINNAGPWTVSVICQHCDIGWAVREEDISLYSKFNNLKKLIEDIK